MIRRAIMGAVGTPAFFFLLGKPAIREHWPITLPFLAVLGAAVAAICEWQIDDCAYGIDDDHDHDTTSHSGTQE